MKPNKILSAIIDEALRHNLGSVYPEKVVVHDIKQSKEKLIVSLEMKHNNKYYFKNFTLE